MLCPGYYSTTSCGRCCVKLLLFALDFFLPSDLHLTKGKVTHVGQIVHDLQIIYILLCHCEYAIVQIQPRTHVLDQRR